MSRERKMERYRAPTLVRTAWAGPWVREAITAGIQPLPLLSEGHHHDSAPGSSVTMRVPTQAARETSRWDTTWVTKWKEPVDLVPGQSAPTQRATIVTS